MSINCFLSLAATMVRVAGPIGLPVLRFGIRPFEPG